MHQRSPGKHIGRCHVLYTDVCALMPSLHCFRLHTEMDLSQVVVKAELLNCVREERESSILKKASTGGDQSPAPLFANSVTSPVLTIQESMQDLYPL